MSAEENMALARRFMEAKIKGDLDAMDAVMAPDYVTHTKVLPGQEPGRERRMWTPRRPSKYVCLETIP